MVATSKTSVTIGLSTTLAELRSLIEEADRLAAPDDARVLNRSAPGGVMSGLVIEWVPTSDIKSDEPVHEFGSPCPCGNAEPRPLTGQGFQVDTVEELLGQLIDACNMALWDEMPSTYPSGAGVFREDAAKRLVEEAMAAYAGLPTAKPEANLGLATTGQILDELRARIKTDYHAGAGGLDYTTVSGRPAAMTLGPNITVVTGPTTTGAPFGDGSSR